MKILLLIFLIAFPLIESCQKTEDATNKPQEKIKATTAAESSKSKNFAQQASSFLKDKNISKPIKGAVIGAVTGALTGAAVSKNDKAKGAIIGGAVGAGAGALTGVAIEKKQKDGKLFKKGFFRKKKNTKAKDEN